MTETASTPTWSRDLLLLALAFIVLYGFRLGSYPLANPDEGRNAEIPREMVAAHEWVTPRLDGVDYFEKPPLMYWAVGGFLELFGPSEWSVRAVPALFALAGVLLTYAATRRLYGRGAGPWWYFIPILLLGFFPWTGFLWPGGREALRGGWKRRRENADAWFFVVWAGFILFFFSISDSKLPPYILPVFPALAVLAGVGMTGAPEPSPAALRWGLRFFSSVCALLAAGALLVVFKRGLAIHDPWQADALRPYAVAMAVILAGGGFLAPWLARRRGARRALGAVLGTMVLFYGVLTYAAPVIQKPGTKDLALYVRAHIRPGDRVLHYHNFFHDFTFYARRLVGVVAYKGELELEEDPAAANSGRFMGEAEFRRLWAGSGRIFVVARTRDAQRLFADPAFHYHLLAHNRDHVLFSNQP